ncbi:MAG: hypothetical protein ACI89L_002799 [Phycisphaerales bacterium]|jgi:hypothetical protein
MTQELRLAIFGGVLPGLLAGLAMLAAWVLRARKLNREARSSANIPDSIRAGTSKGPVWVAPLVLAIGYLGADYATNGVMKLWPDGNTYRFPHAALLLGLVGVLEGVFQGPGFVRTIGVTLARAAALAAGYWMLVEGYHDAGTITSSAFYGAMGVVAIGGSWVIALADLGASAASARVVGPLAALIGAAGIGLLFAAGYALVAQSSAVLVAWGAAATLAAWLVWLYGKRRGIHDNARVIRLDRGGMTVFAGLVVLHAVGARFHTYPGPHGPPGLLLIALAPAGLAALALGRDNETAPQGSWRAGRWRVLAAVALILATLGAAAVPIMLDQPTDNAGVTAGEYYPG